MPHFTIPISAQESGWRIDMALLAFAKSRRLGLSRTTLQKLIQTGNVKIQDTIIVKPHHKVKESDVVSFDVEEQKANELGAEDIALEILYEDSDVAVINKPCGLVVHPAPGNAQHTLVNALLHRFNTLSDINPQRPGIVHRLDKETSGVLVIAKNNAAHLALAEQFAEHSIKRRYIALVKGSMEFDEQVIEAPIGRHPFKRKSMSVGFTAVSKYAKTHYRTLKRTKDYSVLELEPFTGRTHQLRVHLAFIGHPILGDAKYGKHNSFSRLALHAQYLGFMHPTTGAFVEFSCALPDEFKDYLKK
ncbi:MAG: RluA family pseudouridine synthase [Candidatus Omnitrophica bacterium]|nr:RluA family pseudouridine synthase [Candidatus Omnitrophota bacterium]